MACLACMRCAEARAATGAPQKHVCAPIFVLRVKTCAPRLLHLEIFFSYSKINNFNNEALPDLYHTCCSDTPV